MKLFLALFFLSFCISLGAQNEIMIDGRPCPINGSAKPGGRAYYLNERKNRFQIPAAADFDTAVNLDRMLQSADPNEFSEDKAVIITAYVLDVKVGGVETCNCKTQSQAYRDTHIELLVNPENSGPEQRVIAEITPRFRALMSDKEDWSTASIRMKYKGHRVQIAGWLTYDSEHELEAFANDPQNEAGRPNWRGTCWEIHPVTSIKIVDDNVTIDRSIPASSQTKTAGQQQSSKDSRQLWIGIAAIVVLLIIAFVLLRKFL